MKRGQKKNANLLKTCFTLKTELYYLFRQTNWILENELEFRIEMCTKKKPMLHATQTTQWQKYAERPLFFFFFHSRTHSYFRVSALNGVLIGKQKRQQKNKPAKKKLIIDTKTKILLFVFIVFGGRLSKLNDCRKSRLTFIRVINKIMCSSE